MCSKRFCCWFWCGKRIEGKACKKRAYTDEEVQAAIKIQKLSRRFLVRCWLKRFYKHSGSMSQPWWRLTFSSLGFFKILLTLVSIVTALGVTVQENAAIATKGNTDARTPFQNYPHLFGPIYQLLVASHGVTGVLLFLTILVPVLTAKGGGIHIYIGRVVLFVWLWHLLDGLVNASVVLLSRGYNEERYPTDGFSMWLFIQFAFIANCVIDFLFTGLANLQYKIKVPFGARFTVILFNLITLGHATVLITLALYVLFRTNITTDARDYSYVFLTEVPVYAVLSILNIKHWIFPSLQSQLHYWVVEHSRNMIFCVNLTIITGVANITHKYVPGFTIVFWALQDVFAIFWGIRSTKTWTKFLAWSKTKVSPGGFGGVVNQMVAGGAGVGVGAGAGSGSGSGSASGYALRKVAPERRRSGTETDDMNVLPV